MKTHPEAGVPDGPARKGTKGAAGSAIAELTAGSAIGERAVVARL
jgi:hypothetical protein